MRSHGSKYSHQEGASAPPARRQADWRQGWILVFSGFLPVMAIIALAPTLPTLLAHFHDVPNARLMVPLLITAPSACIALFAPAAGVIADRFGRRQLLLWSMAMYGLGGLMPFLIDNFWAVVAGRVVIGIGEAGVLTVVNTLLADYYEERARHRWLMIQGVVGSMLGTLTIAGSGFLAAQGWQWPFLVYAVAIPIFLASVVYLFEPEPRRGQGGAAPAATPFPYMVGLMVCGVTVLLSTIYYVQVINFSLLLKDLGVGDPKSIGLSMAIPSIGVPIGAIVFKLTTRFGAGAQIFLVFFCYAVGLSGIGMAPDYKVALAFAFMQQLANGIIVPALIAWTQSKFSFEHRGRAMGWWASSFFVAQFLSPAVVNLMRGWVGGLQGAFLAFGLIAAVCAIVACLMRLRMPPAQPRASL
ncbi:MFS transporter [Pseudoduganella namucuonensis]|uniref:Predicted arabinose efflux permease, MFS family n=1 Tax=Pseudoduganella namucuonensis TaxID=1035707 RepID=A0A1I7H0G7_9BURK|nr:MFS transporter [Pseudoduganella namucuonensis]SFU54211.1 Predicted arabinose efflux permease, MFS family [Pseudoduganella namucuonensis]